MQQEKEQQKKAATTTTTTGLNKHERKKVIVSSSDGKNAQGGHVLTPTSILSYRFSDSSSTENEEVFEARGTDNVRFMMNTLWSHEIQDVLLPIQSLFDNVPYAPALIRHWIKCKDKNLGGLMFPRHYQDSESLEPVVHIVKKSTPLPGSTSFRAEVTVSIFRRELVECADLQPFDISIWHSKSSYHTWCFFYHNFDVIREVFISDPRLQRHMQGTCELFFRRMMHTHFADCGLVFGKLWCDFGLADMVGVSLKPFMFTVLIDMFVKYRKVSDGEDDPSIPLAALPPMFNASTIAGSGQHICAKCLTYKLGSGKMMRCPCREVFYCCVECQKKDWKVHRLVCGFAAAGAAAGAGKEKKTR